MKQRVKQTCLFKESSFLNDISHGLHLATPGFVDIFESIQLFRLFMLDHPHLINKVCDLIWMEKKQRYEPFRRHLFRHYEARQNERDRHLHRNQRARKATSELHVNERNGLVIHLLGKGHCPSWLKDGAEG